MAQQTSALLDILRSPVSTEYMQRLFRRLEHETFFAKKMNSSQLDVGDNCIAEVFRIKMEGTVKKTEIKKSVIVKKPIDDIINIPPEIFNFESSFYKNVLETLEGTFGQKLPIIRCLHSDLNIMITEDLQDNGWALSSRREGINQNQCAQVIKTLAKFHAASIVLRQSDEIKFKILSQSLQDQVYSDSTEEICKKTFADAYVVAKYYADNYLSKASKHEAAVIKKVFTVSSDEIYKQAKTATKETPIFAKVFAHGNCWANNFMLKEDNSGEHALLINMSTVCPTSPARDLVYLFATNTQVLDKSVLIQLYVEELLTHLYEHKISIDVINQFSIDFIQSELKRLEIVSLFTAMWLLVPITYITSPTVEEYNKTERKDKPELVSKHIDNELYNRRLIEVLLANAESLNESMSS